MMPAEPVPAASVNWQKNTCRAPSARLVGGVARIAAGRAVLALGLAFLLTFGATPLPAVALGSTEGDEPPRWRPLPGTSWQWQLQDEIDTGIDVAVYDVDLFDTPAETIAALKADGRRLICYISVGTVEEWRPDADEVPAEVIGEPYDEWPGERWLDIRRIDLLAPILQARLDRCRDAGFDGVEPDNVDAFTNDTGFDISAADQERFLRWLADEAHARGLAIGLKNVPELLPAVGAAFDFAVTEDCYVDGWCREVAPFIAAGKPVFQAEYTDHVSALRFALAVCPAADRLGFSPILKDRDLGADRAGCG